MCNILEKLKQNTSNLTESQRKAADYIMKNYTEIPFQTIYQLANVIGTSTGTIMRLSHSLGYSGYSDFQKDFQELLRKEGPLQKFQANIKGLDEEDILMQCAETQINNIQSTVNLFSNNLRSNAINKIISARKIYCVGLRSSYSVAHYLYHGLNRLLGNCEILIPSTGDIPERIFSIQSSDVLITCTFPRYSKQVIEIAKFAKGRNATVVSITDGYTSPIANHTDILFPCNFNSNAFHNSVISGIFIADYLISAVAVKNPEKTKTHLQELELAFNKCNFYDS